MKYRDLNIFFSKNPDNGDIQFVSGNSSIMQSIKNIILTKRGEKMFNSSFGTDTLDLLFDSPSTASLQFLQQDLETALTDLEPRIIVDSVEIVYPDTNTSYDILINVNFYLNPQLNQNKSSDRQTLVLTVGAA
jgi:phage baseplate assembly protein W